MTWGQIRFQLTKFAPGVDLQLLNQWINAAYREILNHHPWKGLEGDAVLQTAAIHEDGTVAIAGGATAVTGTGTTFTSAMTGRRFRAAGRSEWYSFTYVSATSGTLDRAYEGETGSELSYRIFQNVYSLPSDVRYIQLLPGMDSKTRAELDRMDRHRVVYGEPFYYSPSSDTDEGAPPVLHTVELYPVPEDAKGYPYSFQKAVFEFDGSNTAWSPLPWVSVDAILSGAKVRVLAHQKDHAGAKDERATALGFRRQMVAEETRRTGPGRIAMASVFTAHRRRRWQR